jgi:type II secretion system protein J
MKIHPITVSHELDESWVRRARCPQRAANDSTPCSAARFAEDSEAYLAGAFTLIEMMIALAVFAIILTAMNGVFWGALRLRNKTVDSIDAAIPQEHALSVIRNDLINIVPPGGRFFTAFTTTAATTNANGMVMNVMPGQTSPEFTTSNGVIDDSSNWGDIQRVSYQLMNSTNGNYGRDLYRIVTRNLLPSAQQNFNQDQQPILSGVQSINFSYHDGSMWKDIWDSTNEILILPRAIKVEIQMAGQGRGRMLPPPVQIVVPLIDAGTNTTQVAATQ